MAAPSLPLSPEAVLRFDGSCSPNPGPMGIGYTLTLGGVNDTAGAKPLVRVGAYVGDGTNNIAEYHGLIAGLRHAIRLGLWTLHVRSDSLLVVKQLEGAWKVRDGTLRRLHGEGAALLTLLRGHTLAHVRREENDEADGLSRSITWEEPTLPPIPQPKGHPRALYGWQAAFIRHHYAAGIRNGYFMGRIFDISPNQADAIGYGKTYQDASFDGMPVYPS